MKEQKILELKNKVETLGKVNTYLMKEVSMLEDLAIGTLETIKLMNGYEKAIEKLKEKMVAKPGETAEADTGGKIIN